MFNIRNNNHKGDIFGILITSFIARVRNMSMFRGGGP